MSKRTWTRAEDNKLRSLMSGYSWPAIARIMGRPVGSCLQRARRLGLKHQGRRESNGGWFSIRDLVDVLGVDRPWVVHRIKSGELQSVEFDGEPHVSGFVLRDYLRDHASLFVGQPLDTVVIFDLFCNRDADR